MLVASLCFALMGVCVKYISDDVPVGEVVFGRSLIATLIALAWGWRDRGRLLGVSRRMLVTRSLVGLGSMYAYFFAISQLKLGDAVLITYLSPLIVASMAPFVLGERAPWPVWLALGVGFAGVAVVEDPSGAVAGAGLVAGIASAFLAASAYVSVKLLSRTDSTTTIVVWFSAIATLVSGVEGAVRGTFVWPAPEHLLALAGVGVFAALAQLLMTRAYAVAEAARVSVFGYATPIIAYVLGQLVLREEIGWRGALGCSLLVLAGVLASFLGRPRPAAAA